MSNQKEITRRNRLMGYTFLLPNILGYLLFTLIPVIASLVISFTDWDGFSKATFVGFQNYLKLLDSETFCISFFNTIYYTTVSVPVTLALALGGALLLNEKIKGIKFFRTAFFLPYISATVAVAVVWQLLYHPTMGPINGFLIQIGIKHPPRWLSSAEWAMTSVIIMTTWKMIGYYLVIFLAGLQGIPKQLYEAAEVDGARPWAKFIHVTIPMLSPAIFFAVIIGVINSFKVFDQIYTLTEGGPGRATQVLAFTIYQEAFVKYRFGTASAIAYVLFFMIMVVTIIQFKGQKKWVNY